MTLSCCSSDMAGTSTPYECGISAARQGGGGISNHKNILGAQENQGSRPMTGAAPQISAMTGAVPADQLSEAALRAEKRDPRWRGSLCVEITAIRGAMAPVDERGHVDAGYWRVDGCVIVRG